MIDSVLEPSSTPAVTPSSESEAIKTHTEQTGARAIS
jgi:hypothetical protein